MADTHKLLIVDDSPIAIELILSYLGDCDYDTVIARDGIEAWEILQSGEHDFDAVLLDRMMPRMDGITLLQLIKDDEDHKMLPVILQTASAEREDIIEGIQAGAYYYLTKPLERQMLLSIVSAAISDHDQNTSLRREARRHAGMLRLMRGGAFEFRTLAEASDLGHFLSQACPDPERVGMGLGELLVNAVEHGNLGITYEEKSALKSADRLADEIERRLGRDPWSQRTATVRFERSAGRIDFFIRDQGDGFDPAPYMNIDPSRVFDAHGRGIAMARLLSFDQLRYRAEGREAVASLNLS